MTDKIFGYSWEQIQAAQRGGRLIADRSAPIIDADTVAASDAALLAEHGMEGLIRLGYYGTIDRLNRKA